MVESKKKTKKSILNNLTKNNIFLILFFMASLLVNIGYASINSISMNIYGAFDVQAWDGVFINDVSVFGNNGVIVDSYYQTLLDSTVVLENDIASEVSLQVSVHNSTNSDYIFDDVLFIVGDDTYSNSNIGFYLTGLEKNYILHGKDTVVFTITFYYIGDSLPASNILISLLNFNFEEYITAQITYDYNYLPDDQFENYYDTSSFRPCCDVSMDSYFISTGSSWSSSGLTYTALRNPKFVNEYDRGYFFWNKVSYPLTDGEVYTVVFEARGSDDFSAIIGSEQGGEITYEITSNWKRYSSTFTAYTRDPLLAAFVVYDWASDTSERTLELRNVQFQQGELYSDSVVLRSGQKFGDNLIIPNRNGWNFLGWFTEPVGGIVVSSDSLVPGENTIYYAHWEYVG